MYILCLIMNPSGLAWQYRTFYSNPPCQTAIRVTSEWLEYKENHRLGEVKQLNFKYFEKGAQIWRKNIFSACTRTQIRTFFLKSFEHFTQILLVKSPFVWRWSALLSDLLMNPWLNKSKRVFYPGGARTHITREIVFSGQMPYQLSYRGLMLGEIIFLVCILIPIFLIIFHHYLIFLETRPSWKGQ